MSILQLECSSTRPILSAIEENFSVIQSKLVALSSNITEVASTFDATNAKVSELSRSVAALHLARADQQPTTNSCQTIKNTVEELLGERSDAQERKLNALLFNLQEPPQDPPDTPLSDENQVEKVLQSMGFSTDERSTLKWQRLGKPQPKSPQHQKPRPIKISFPNLHLKRKFLTGMKAHRAEHPQERLAASIDRSLKQREDHKRARVEILTRIQGGETNLCIRDGLVVSKPILVHRKTLDKSQYNQTTNACSASGNPTDPSSADPHTVHSVHLLETAISSANAMRDTAHPAHIRATTQSVHGETSVNSQTLPKNSKIPALN